MNQNAGRSKWGAPAVPDMLRESADYLPKLSPSLTKDKYDDINLRTPHQKRKIIDAG